MAYVAVNPLLYNAAVAGYLGGMYAGQFPTDTTAADYLASVTEAQNFAQELDTTIPADAAITTGGVAVAPTTGTIIEKEVGKAGIVQALSFGVGFQRFSTGQLAASFAAVAAGIAALYAEAVTVLLTP